MLVDRDNILDIIKKYQEEMDDIDRELKKITNDTVRNALKERLVDLATKKFGHELTASKWGLMPRPSLPIETEHYVIFEGWCDSKNEESD